jgi:hypothetical protein
MVLTLQQKPGVLTASVRNMAAALRHYPSMWVDRCAFCANAPKASGRSAPNSDDAAIQAKAGRLIEH